MWLGFEHGVNVEQVNTYSSTVYDEYQMEETCKVLVSNLQGCRIKL